MLTSELKRELGRRYYRARKIVDDGVKTARFMLNPTMRAEARRRYEECQSTEDFFRFTAREFGRWPMQKTDEMVPFVDYLTEHKPAVACEVGTASGATNFILTQSVPSIRRMIGVDLLVQNRALLHQYRRPDQALRYINGSSHDGKTRRKVEAWLGGDQLDLLFIDGDHTFDGVLRDFLDYRPFVRDGGLIAFHDIVPDNVLRGTAVTSAAWAGEVPVFWQQLKDHYPHREFVADWSQEGFGIGVITFDRSVHCDRQSFRI